MKKSSYPHLRGYTRQKKINWGAIIWSACIVGMSAVAIHLYMKSKADPIEAKYAIAKPSPED